MWALACAVLIPPDLDFSTSVLSDDIARIPHQLHLPLLVGGVYLLGVVATGASGLVVQVAREIVGRVRLHDGLPKTRIHRIAERAWNRLPRDPFGFRPVEDAYETVESGLAERLRHLSENLVTLVPAEFVIDELNMAAMKMSTEAPEQHQEFDRVRSEGDFRRALGTPLVVLGIGGALEFRGLSGILVVAITVVVAAILFREGAEESRRARDLLASAFYFGLTSTPLLQTLLSEYERDRKGLREDARGSGLPSYLSDLAWFINFLAERSLLDRYPRPLSMLRHPSRFASIRKNEVFAGTLIPTAKYQIDTSFKAIYDEPYFIGNAATE